MVERPLRVVSLFSGLEGIGLGLELVADIEVAAQVEIDPWCRAVLARSYPDAAQLGDVHGLDRGDFPDGTVDVLTAGFPCQPVSDAGLGLGVEDERWLWPEVERVLTLLRPRYLIAENVRGLLRRGMRPVLAGLRDAGYEAQWDLWPAAAVGAPHLRHRVWIVAWREGERIGPVFDRPPDVAAYWAATPEPLPRLLPRVPNRKDKLTALGNSVVPQAAAAVASALLAARDKEPLSAPDLLGWRVEDVTRFRPAGALLSGLVHFQTSSVGRIRRRLWPTPTATDGKGSRRTTARQPHWASKDGVTLTDAAVLWPTPNASDGGGGRNERGALDRAGDPAARTLSRPSGAKAALSLATAAEAADLLPTPTAADGERSSAQLRRHYAEGTDNPTLRGAAERIEDENLFLTPTAAPTSGGGRGGPLQMQVADRQERLHDDHFWPTPSAQESEWTIDAIRACVTKDGRAARNPHVRFYHPETGQIVQRTLDTYVKGVEEGLWPEPTATRPVQVVDGSGDDHKESARTRRDGGEDLAKYANRLWPTAKSSPSGPDFARRRRGDSGGDDLQTAVVRGERQKRAASGLNPAWVEWLLGYPPGWVELSDDEIPDECRRGRGRKKFAA